VGKKLATLCFFALCAAGAFAENENLNLKSTVDWQRGVLILEITTRLDLDRARFPEARREAELRVEAGRGELFLKAVSPVALRSDRTIGEFLADPGANQLIQRRFTAALDGLALSGRKTISVVSEDFNSLRIVYEYGFFGETGLVAPFVVQDRPVPFPASPGYHGTAPFSGLVIYARGKYISFGKNTEAVWVCTPALFPRIYYLSARNTIEPVLDMTMVDPDALKQWGLLEYVRSTDKSDYAARAGLNPLTVTAFALYGTNDTDLVISEEAARMLLASVQNRALLRRGKIVVVID
jgi:hypothetical protein